MVARGRPIGKALHRSRALGGVANKLSATALSEGVLERSMLPTTPVART